MALVYTVSLLSYDAGFVPIWHRFCTGAGFINNGSDEASGFGFISNPGEFYEPRILQPGWLRTEIKVDGIFGGGRASSEIGEIVLANVDGALDSMRDFSFDGRNAGIFIFDDETGLAVISSFVRALVKTVRYDSKSVTVVINSPMADLAAKPLHTVRYLGNNSGGNGKEGTAADVQDIVKPILLGNKTNLPTVLVNPGKLIYHVALDQGGSINVTGAYFGGVALTNAGTVANVDTAAAPATGTFISDASGCIRVAAPVLGRVTANAQVSMSLGDIIKTIAGIGGVSSGSVNAADVSAANTAYGSAHSPYFYSNQEQTVGEALDALCSGFGYFWYFDKDYIFRFVKITAPSGSPVLSLTEDQILSVDIADNGDVPPKRVTCRYDRNFAVMERSELGASLTEAQIQTFGLDYRKQSASTSSAHPTAGEYIFDANTAAGGTALSLASERLSLQNTASLALSVVCDFRSIAAPELGSVVKVTLPRFGMQAGKLFRVVGTEHDLRKNQLELKLWG